MELIPNPLDAKPARSEKIREKSIKQSNNRRSESAVGGSV
jgi:hypothetical protein